MTKAYIGDKQVVKIMLGNTLVWSLSVNMPYSSNSFIRVGSTDEVLGSNAAVPNASTTDWFTVTPSTTYRLNATQSDKRRIQSKSATGIITYMTSSSADSTADGYLLTTRTDAVQIRLYFATSPDLTKPLTISIAEV